MLGLLEIRLNLSVSLLHSISAALNWVHDEVILKLKSLELEKISTDGGSSGVLF